ncbi:hypothetical protein ACMA5I_12595 [Paracoccaceae bacterium GXU_MW_L88]
MSQDEFLVSDLQHIGFAPEEGLHMDFAIGPWTGRTAFEKRDGATFTANSIDIDSLGNGFLIESFVFDPETFEGETIIEEAIWDDGRFTGYRDGQKVAEVYTRFATVDQAYTYRFPDAFQQIDRLEISLSLDGFPELSDDQTLLQEDHHARFTNFVYDEVIAPVPLPGGAFLMGLGLVGLGAMARRRAA